MKVDVHNNEKFGSVYEIKFGNFELTIFNHSTIDTKCVCLRSGPVSFTLDEKDGEDYEDFFSACVETIRKLNEEKVINQQQETTAA